jgi:hypothetical protein
VFVQRIHKRAIEAFKCFRWMLDGTDQCTGHFHLTPGRRQTIGRLPLLQRILFTFAALGPVS